MTRHLVICQDCDSPEYEFPTENDRISWEHLHYDQTGHERFFERDIPTDMPPPVRVNGRMRLFVSRYDGRCLRCGEPYKAGQEIERLVPTGFAGPCCATPAPTADLTGGVRD
ncbi:hypothetical protein [Amycolatopsis thermoflava]|uniref:hypothetical protein n=1 Tax=Amycolatopsis thermoflava TaxID=84480 RepID=UPI0003FD224B|nr:hypothetical protein [Amycolatopsis thermoflava]